MRDRAVGMGVAFCKGQVCSRARGGAGKVAQMCIPIELDVPVVTLDQHEIGIAREIICSCPGDLASDGSLLPGALSTVSGPGDLWLRVTRSARPDLFVPFGEIAETRSDGVRLRIEESGLARRGWERPPATLPIPA
jgi:hypothetical protein